MTDALNFASLPWYDLPASRADLDTLWTTTAGLLLTRTGLPLAPALERQRPVTQQWQSPHLVLSQCCGPDLFTRGQALRVIGRPSLPGLDCEPGDYYSYIVSGSDGLPAGPLRIVVNGMSSWSGHHALRGWLQEQGIEVAAMTVSGAHAASIAAIAQGTADIAAIDAYTWQLLAPRKLRIIGHTANCLAPPFVQHEASAIPAETLFAALEAAIQSQPAPFTGILPADTALYRKQLAAAGHLDNTDHPAPTTGSPVQPDLY